MDAPKENTNCLMNMKCPKCGSLGNFNIVVTALARVSDAGTDNFTEVEWADDAFCECRQCDFQGKVQDFSTISVNALVDKALSMKLDNVLDTDVHETASMLASNVNNRGIEGQVRFLCTHLGIRSVKETLDQLSNQA